MPQQAIEVQAGMTTTLFWKIVIVGIHIAIILHEVIDTQNLLNIYNYCLNLYRLTV